MKKQAEELIKHFFKVDIQMTKKPMKKCSASLVIVKMQIKTTRCCQLTLDKVAIIQKKKKVRDNRCQQRCGEKKFFKNTLRQCSSGVLSGKVTMIVGNDIQVSRPEGTGHTQSESKPRGQFDHCIDIIQGVKHE